MPPRQSSVPVCLIVLSLLVLAALVPQPAPAQGPPPITFAAPVHYPVPGADFVHAADLDGDMFLDLAVISNADLAILYGRGDGTFEAPAYLPVGDGQNEVLDADVNRDGKPDLAVTHYGGNRVAVLINQGSRLFAPAVYYGVGMKPYGIAAGNFNQDQFPDLAVANDDEHTMCVLLNQGNGTFGTATFYPAGGSFPSGILAADLNGDAKLDLAMGNYVSANVKIYWGNGAGGFTAGTSYGVRGEYPSRVILADLNGDGKPDLATPNTFSHNISILPGAGGGEFRTAVVYPSDSLPYVLRTADLDQDGRNDLVVPNNGTDHFSVLRNLNNTSFSLPIPFVAGGTNTRTLAIGDFDRDGSTDVAIGDPEAARVSVFLNTTSDVPACTLAVASPNGGEGWTTGTSQNITWSGTTAGSSVKLELSRDGGATWSTLAASTPDDGVFAWTVTSPDTSQARVRVSSVESPSCSDTSNGNFTVRGPCVAALTAPVGGESWQAGSQHNITWTSANLTGSVKIDYSTDGGATWSPIVSVYPNSGSYAWTVPSVATTQARVRLASVAEPTCIDTNDGNFTITQPPSCAISVTAPNGGEQWPVGTSQNITWTGANAGSSVTIELSRDGGGTWTSLGANVPNNGSYAWTVAGPVGTQVRVRVSSAATPGCLDTSDGNLAITRPTPPSVSLSSLAVRPTKVKGGRGAVGTVSLSDAAPAGGVIVNLSSNNAAASVPTSVTVAAASATATFAVTTRRVNRGTSATLAATYAGVTKTAVLKITKK